MMFPFRNTQTTKLTQHGNPQKIPFQNRTEQWTNLKGNNKTYVCSTAPVWKTSVDKWKLMNKLPCHM